MPARLSWNGYGKAAVRVVTVARDGDRRRLTDLTVDVRLEGRFDAAHAGDNSAVLPTDTMRNTVYALAKQGPVDPPEEFGRRLGTRFLEACPAADRATVALAAHRWARLEVGGVPQDHAFERGTAERRTATVAMERGGAKVSAGIEGLVLLRCSGSGFEGFLHDQFTALRETDDRILATEVSATWRYSAAPPSWTAAWDVVRSALVAAFAGPPSRSVQESLLIMGNAAIAACDQVDEIRLTLPNRHHLLVDLSPFGLENPDEIFVPISEPYGLIEGVVSRSG
jgi:urate oxidase